MVRRLCRLPPMFVERLEMVRIEKRVSIYHLQLCHVYYAMCMQQQSFNTRGFTDSRSVRYIL